MSDQSEGKLIECRGRLVFTGEQARMLVEAERRSAAFRPFEREQFERMRQRADGELNRMILGVPESRGHDPGASGAGCNCLDPSSPGRPPDNGEPKGG